MISISSSTRHRAFARRCATTVCLLVAMIAYVSGTGQVVAQGATGDLPVVTLHNHKADKSIGFPTHEEFYVEVDTALDEDLTVEFSAGTRLFKQPTTLINSEQTHFATIKAGSKRSAFFDVDFNVLVGLQGRSLGAKEQPGLEVVLKLISPSQEPPRYDLGDPSTYIASFSTFRLALTKLINEDANGNVPAFDGAFKFTVSGAERPQRDLKVGQLKTFSIREAKRVTVTETPVPGFYLSDAICTIGEGANLRPVPVTLGTSSFTLDIDPSQRTDCTVVNTPGEPPNPLPKPTLTIVKKTIGADGTFPFTVRGKGNDAKAFPADPVITTENNRGKVTLTQFSAGEWEIVETNDNPDFKLTDISCVDENDPTFAEPGRYDRILPQRKAVISAANGGKYRCTFTNTFAIPRNEARLTVKKKTAGAHALEEFTFEVDDPFFDGPATLKARSTGGTVSAGAAIFASVGNKITITEQNNDNFTFASVDCGTAEHTPTPGKAEVVVTPKDGEAVTCTFTNKAVQPDPTTLTLVKVAQGRGGSFTFRGSGSNTFVQTARVARADTPTEFAQLTVVPGKLTLSEDADDQFELVGADCRLRDGGTLNFISGNLKTRTGVIDIPEGENVRCVFTNQFIGPPSTLAIVKNTIGGDGTFTFSGSGSTKFSRSVTTANGVGQLPDVIAIQTGQLTLKEDVAKGFKLDRIACTGRDPVHNPQDHSIHLDVVAGEDITCTFTNREVAGRTTAIIRNFLNRRAEHLTADTGRPRLLERRRNFASPGLKDALGVKGAGSLKDGSASYRTSLGQALGDQTTTKAARLGVRASEYGITAGSSHHRPGWDLWSEGRLNYFETDGDGGTSGHFGMVRIGADYLVAPSFLVGVLAQYDRLKEDGVGYGISGQGFMVGPYAEYELAKGLYLDAKALWGRSKNDISPFDTYTDSFATTRWLAAARLTGSWEYATSARSAWHVSPRAEIVYFSDSAESYTDANGIAIEGQRVNLGRVKVGPEVSYRYTTPDGMRIEPRVSVKGLWAFGRGRDAQAASSTISQRPVDEFQLQLNGGLQLEASNGMRLDLEGGYTGFGSSGNRSSGGKLSVTIPLQSNN